MILRDVIPVQRKNSLLEMLVDVIAKMFLYVTHALLICYLAAGSSTVSITNDKEISNLTPKRFAREPARWDAETSKYVKEDESRTKFADICCKTMTFTTSDDAASTLCRFILQFGDIYRNYFEGTLVLDTAKSAELLETMEQLDDLRASCVATAKDLKFGNGSDFLSVNYRW